MAKTVRARVGKGVLELLEPVELPEGEEVRVDIISDKEAAAARTEVLRMARETSERVAATGISQKELEKLIQEEVDAVRHAKGNVIARD